jgi:hypothetical protein
VPFEIDEKYHEIMDKAWQDLLELDDEQVKQIGEFYEPVGWHSNVLQSFTNDSNDFTDAFVQTARHMKIGSTMLNPGYITIHLE